MKVSLDFESECPFLPVSLECTWHGPGGLHDHDGHAAHCLVQPDVHAADAPAAGYPANHTARSAVAARDKIPYAISGERGDTLPLVSSGS